MASYVELLIDQGTTFSNKITLTDDTTNQPVNVATYIVTSQMRRSYASRNSSANIVCSISNAAGGEITMSLGANTTANLRAGRYFFDVKVDKGANGVSRLVEGMITITPGVTR